MWCIYHGEEPRFWVLVIQKLTRVRTRGRMHDSDVQIDFDNTSFDLTARVTES